jgi:hypothetical protein
MGMNTNEPMDAEVLAALVDVAEEAVHSDDNNDEGYGNDDDSNVHAC